jgi:SnoaL-like domain
MMRTESMPGGKIAVLRQMLTAPQSLDTYVSHFLPNARYRFGNNPLIQGSTHIQAAAERFRSRLRGVHHDIKAIWEQEDTVICQMEVTYTRLDGQSLQLPCFCAAIQGGLKPPSPTLSYQL